MALIIAPSDLSERAKAFTTEKEIIHLHYFVASRMKLNNYVDSDD